MKSLLASLWKRRWCRLVGAVLIVCALPLLHPFVRQSIFGPQIDGIPWCVWEDEIRNSVHPEPERRGWFYRFMARFGLFERQDFGLDRNLEALPVYLHLADDSDVKVRRHAIGQLCDWVAKYDESLPVMRRHLDDDDPLCRLAAAQAVWHATKEKETIDLVLPFKDHSDPAVRQRAVYVLGYMARNEPSLFETISRFTTDADAYVRIDAVNSLRVFGKRAVPILRQALRDPVQNVRHTAIHVTAELRTDGAALYPELLAMQNDPDPDIGRNASRALYRMYPMQFAKPANWDE